MSQHSYPSKTLLKQSGHVTTRFHLGNPLEVDSTWPDISPGDQESIFELLCSLLSPIGAHRQTHTTPSKGKRSQKRKRHDEEVPAVASAQPSPEIATQVLIGFNSITRHLQTICHESSMYLISDPENGEESHDRIQENEGTKRIAAIFTTNPSPAQATLHSHFPPLVAAASGPNQYPIRLVRLPRGCENRLAASLNLPRVNFVAVMEKAEGAGVLLALVRDRVRVLESRTGEATYQSVKIVGVDGPVGARKGNIGAGKKQKRGGR